MAIRRDEANGEEYIDNGVDCCPDCKNVVITVTDSRSTKLGRRRRRYCSNCRLRWGTLELNIGNEESVAQAERERIRKEVAEQLIKILLEHTGLS